VLHHAAAATAQDIWRYVLRIRTNRVVSGATALAYPFSAGVQTFAVELVGSRFDLSESSAAAILVLLGVGALDGVVSAGRLSDRPLRRGRPNARVLVGAIAYVLAAVAFVPALLSAALVVSVPLFVVGAAGLAAPDSALNAARLDIMHPRLWGRAEGVRSSSGHGVGVPVGLPGTRMLIGSSGQGRGAPAGSGRFARSPLAPSRPA
jgi:sugar phosphate permease